MSALRTKPMRLSASRPSRRERACCGSRYCNPMKARSPAVRPSMALTGLASRDDSPEVARNDAGFVGRAEKSGHLCCRIDEKDRRRMVDRVAAVRGRRTDDDRDAERAGPGLDRSRTPRDTLERRIEMSDVAAEE